MSARIEGIACPMCHTVLSLEQITQQLDNEHAFAHLLALSVPLPHQVMQYMTLFTPPLQGLTLRKKLRIVKPLLPDMRRETVTHAGRDWPAPLAAWAQAFEQMQASRSAGRLDLPMQNHKYLYSILSGMANKHEAAAEQAREQQLRTGPRAATVNGPTSVSALVQAPAPSAAPRPAPAAPAPAGMSPTVRAMRAEIQSKKGTAP